MLEVILKRQPDRTLPYRDKVGQLSKTYEYKAVNPLVYAIAEGADGLLRWTYLTTKGTNYDDEYAVVIPHTGYLNGFVVTVDDAIAISGRDDALVAADWLRNQVRASTVIGDNTT